MSPALEGGFFTTESLGKPAKRIFKRALILNKCPLGTYRKIRLKKESKRGRRKERREKYVQNTLAVYIQNTSLACLGEENQRTKCQELQMALKLV